MKTEKPEKQTNTTNFFLLLFHVKDADVGVRELGLTYMKGEYAHAGFPEQAFNRMATALVERGYKVARIEQTETREMNTERTKKMAKATKFDKVVRRELCQVITKGTQVFGQQFDIPHDYEPRYIVAIAEKASLTGLRFGVAFIDTSIGEFNIGEFNDDKQWSLLLTLLSHNPPVLVFHERGGISSMVQQISNTIREVSLAGKQFLHAEKTLKNMSEQYYGLNNEKEWPEVIRVMQDENDHLGLTPNGNYRLALKALGGCLYYLTKCVIDELDESVTTITKKKRINTFGNKNRSLNHPDSRAILFKQKEYNKKKILVGTH